MALRLMAHRAGMRVLPVLLVALSACATYRDDLKRAQVHYAANEYDKALVLLEVLEPDIDSLSDAERVQYSYIRGMSHLRLEQKRDARHWLGNASARELAAKGSLTPDENKRAEEKLAELNPSYWGETSSLDEKTGNTSGEGKSESSTKCKTDLDCVKGQFCDDHVCKKTGDDGEKSDKKSDKKKDKEE